MGFFVCVIMAHEYSLEKKVYFHFKRLEKSFDEKTTEEQKEAAVKDAYMLASGGQSPDPLNMAYNGGGAPKGGNKEQGKGDISSSADLVDVAKKIDPELSDKDIKNYEGKDTKFGESAIEIEGS